MKRLAIRQSHFLAEQFDFRLEPERLRLMPEVVERPALDQRAEGAEGMPEILARFRPVDELGSQAVRGLRLVDEVVLVCAEETQQIEDGGLCRLGAARNHGFGRLDHVN